MKLDNNEYRELIIHRFILGTSFSKRSFMITTQLVQIERINGDKLLRQRITGCIEAWPNI